MSIISSNNLLLLLLGLAAGVLSGMFGVGGGTLIVPGLTMLLGFDIKTATGTSLAALLLPFSIMAVLEYYRAGHINVLAALLIVTGMFIGSVFGAKVTLSLPEIYVKRAFGMYMVLIGAKYLLGK